jgi:pyruvate formate lyase activating enzyme
MIRALIETSLIDWDGKITMVLFSDACNLKCPFCQNWELLTSPRNHAIVPWQAIERVLRNKDTWLDGVVLTGGEPLVDPTETTKLCEQIKRLGKMVKLDTNGTFPDALQHLVSQKLIDYVAMDIKAPLDDRYAIAAGTAVEISALQRSINLLMAGTIPYEFRTTCVPGIIDADTIHAIGTAIQHADTWALQAYVPAHARVAAYRRELPPGYPDTLRSYLTIARGYVTHSLLRGRI